MSEAIRIGANVATPLGLVGMVAALILFGYYHYLKHQERKLLALPESERAKRVDLWYSQIGLDISNLTREQKFEFISRELERRAAQARLLIVTLALVIVICFAIAAIAFISNPGEMKQNTNGALLIAVLARSAPLAIGFALLLMSYRLVSRSALVAVLFALFAMIVISIVLIRGFTFRSPKLEISLTPRDPIEELEGAISNIERDLSQLDETESMFQELSSVSQLYFNSTAVPLAGLGITSVRQVELRARQSKLQRILDDLRAKRTRS
jgi:hypothetical protein